jgi:hypothetical protein
MASHKKILARLVARAQNLQFQGDPSQLEALLFDMDRVLDAILKTPEGPHWSYQLVALSARLTELSQQVACQIEQTRTELLNIRSGQTAIRCYQGKTVN